MSTIIGLVSTFRLPLQKTEFIGTFCCVDSLNDRKWLKCSYKRIKNTDKVHIMV